MAKDELNKLSHEDLSLFEECLTAFFKMSVDQSYIQLRNHLERRLPRSRFPNADELIDNTITRLAIKVVELEKRGERIKDLRAYASKIAPMIVREYYKKVVYSIELDAAKDPESPSRPREIKYSPNTEIDAITKEIERDCMLECLEAISRERLDLLLAYYEEDVEKRKENRRKLALTTRGGNVGSETPSDQQARNLCTQVSKLKSRLKKCLEECFEAKTARNHKLAFLNAQQM